MASTPPIALAHPIESHHSQSNKTPLSHSGVLRMSTIAVQQYSVLLSSLSPTPSSEKRIKHNTKHNTNRTKESKTHKYSQHTQFCYHLPHLLHAVIHVCIQLIEEENTITSMDSIHITVQHDRLPYRLEEERSWGRVICSLGVKRFEVRNGKSALLNWKDLERGLHREK